MIFLVLFLNATQLSSFADSPSWYCKEVTSERKGDEVWACGVGKGAGENEARSSAFDNAKKEFLKVCSLSDNCKNHKINVSPARTTCEPDAKLTKCYRLIVFSVGPKADESPKEDTTVELSSKVNGTEMNPEMHKDTPIERIEDTSVREVFKPFIYSQISSNPKISKGMPKATLLYKFGAPQSIVEVSEIKIFFFRGEMCLYSSCTANIKNDLVESFEDFKPIYTDLLK